MPSRKTLREAPVAKKKRSIRCDYCGYKKPHRRGWDRCRDCAKAQIRSWRRQVLNSRGFSDQEIEEMEEEVAEAVRCMTRGKASD